MKVFGGILAVLALALTVTAGPARAAPGADGPYYVVGTGSDGQKEYLFQIAARTLGDGNRYREIYDLNKGREQPDGGRLSDPLVLSPGWVLLLPADASGDLVRTGVPPSAEPSTDVALYVWFGAGVVVLAVLLAILRRIMFRRKPPLSGAAVESPASPPAPAPASACSEVRVELPLRCTVSTSAGLLDVRLAGSETGAVRWSDGSGQPSMTIGVELGRDGSQRLWADLALAPGPMTVTGPEDAASAQARVLADRLHDAGHRVLVVGGALEARPGWTELSALPSEEELPGGTGVLVCAGLHGDDLAAVRMLTTAAAGRSFAAIVVGRAVRGRWSLTARTTGAER